MVQPWNLGPPVMNFSALGNLGTSFTSAYDGARKRTQEDEKRALLATAVQGGDLSKLGMGLIATGDVQGGAALAALGQKEAERKAEAETARSWGDPVAPVAPVNPSEALTTRPRFMQPQAAVAPTRGVQIAETEEDVQRLEAEASGLSQIGNPRQPRGLRNNNPGNIESGRFAATIQGFEGSDGRFARYETPEQGIRAADKLLQSYAGRGLTTVAGIVNRWAPPSENNTGAYAAQVARELGVDPNQPLDMTSPETRQRLIAAKIRVENGRQPYSEDVFQRALNPDWGRQVAQAGQEQPASPQLVQGGGTYAQSSTEELQAFLANPRVPENLRGMMREELARRQGGQQPVQVAQAPAQPGTPMSDAPAPGAAPAQGFAIPGTGEVVSQTIANDPQVKLWSDRLASTTSERLRAIAKNKLDLAVKDAEQRRTDGRDPESVREFVWARRNGMTTAKTPAEYAREKADNAPTTRQIKQPDGSEVAVQWDASNRQWIPLAAPEGGNAVKPQGQKLTEGQSKDLIYHNRGLQALEAFEPVSAAYADGVSRIAAQVPGGNYVVPEQFQLARQAGRNFLASVLRKDTGAAVTPSEEQLYGDIFLPAPGDKPGTLAQKAEARKQAIDAIRGGLGTAEVLALGKRLTQRNPGEDAPARAAPAQPAAAPRAVSTPQDYQALKPGDTYTDPQGNVRTKR